MLYILFVVACPHLHSFSYSPTPPPLHRLSHSQTLTQTSNGQNTIFTLKIHNKSASSLTGSSHPEPGDPHPLATSSTLENEICQPSSSFLAPPSVHPSHLFFLPRLPLCCEPRGQTTDMLRMIAALPIRCFLSHSVSVSRVITRCWINFGLTCHEV